MKKVFFGLLFALLIVEVAFLYAPKSATAEETTPSGIKRVQAILKERVEVRKEKVAEKKEVLKERVEVRKEDRVERVRKAAVARYEVHKRAIGKAESLLDKLQVRIDRAKEAGKDVSEAERLMADSKGKLADVKVQLAAIEGKKGAAVDKAGFQEIQDLFKAINKDLQVIRHNSAKVISILKGFNSATSEGKNSQKEGTSPASTSVSQ